METGRGNQTQPGDGVGDTAGDTAGDAGTGAAPSLATPLPVSGLRAVLVHVGVLVVGVALFFVGWVVLGADSQGQAGDAITTGTVIKVTNRAPAAGGPHCQPSATFEAKSSTWTASGDAVASPSCPFQVGDEVRIAYNPTDPVQASVLDAGPITWLRWLTVLVGCVASLYGGVWLVRHLALASSRGAKHR